MVIAQQELKELIEYDPDTGHFKWLVKRHHIKAGSPAGSKCNGYLYIKIKGKLYRANRLAWFYMTGEWPTELIDHRDTDKLNNKWENLRPASHSQNSWDAGLSVDSTSGIKGVNFHKQLSKWMARVSVSNRRLHLGLYDTKEEAEAACVSARAKHHKEFARDK